MEHQELSEGQRKLAINITYVLQHSQIFVETGLAVLNNKPVIFAKPLFIFKDMKEDIVYTAELPSEETLATEEAVKDKSKDIISGLFYEYLSGGREFLLEVKWQQSESTSD